MADAKPEQFAKLARAFRGDVNQLRREVDFWNEQRISYGLTRKRENSDLKLGRRAPETTEPTYRDRRRAAIADSYLQTTADQIERDSQEGRVSEAAEEVPYQLNEQRDGKLTRRAQIADALLQSEEDEANGDGY